MARRLSEMKRATTVISSISKAWKSFTRKASLISSPRTSKTIYTRDPELRALEKEMHTLAQTGGGSKARSQPKQRYANRLKKLKNQALRQYQEHWIRERRDWKILTRGKEAAQNKSKTDFIQSIYLLIPERGRLAQQMAVDHALEPAEMWQALQDLYNLCVQDFTVLYLPKSRPVDGAYPLKCCQLRMNR